MYIVEIWRICVQNVLTYMHMKKQWNFLNLYIKEVPKDVKWHVSPNSWELHAEVPTRTHQKRQNMPRNPLVLTLTATWRYKYRYLDVFPPS
jgi:hypothetical protein